MPTERERRLTRERQQRFQERKRKRQVRDGTRAPEAAPSRFAGAPSEAPGVMSDEELRDVEARLFGK
jgi:hypothetical protein